MEESRLSGRAWALWKGVVCVDYFGMCGIVWAIRNKLDYIEQISVCGSE